MLYLCVFSWKSVADYIDQQFEQYFRDESGLNRKNIQDNRVHCCLYFISPFGHGYVRHQRYKHRSDLTYLTSLWWCGVVVEDQGLELVFKLHKG